MLKIKGLTLQYLFLVTFMILSFVVIAQEDTINLYDMDFEQLSKITVTSATKYPEKISKIPSTVQVISGAEVREKGYFMLEEVLSDLPGFQFRNIQGFNSYVFQRGIPNQNNLILVLIDGIQINELNSGGFYGGGQFNLANVERIEVIYGPKSVAYGTNAISGIINIITNDPKENRVEINSLAGNFDTYSTDVTCSLWDKDKQQGMLVSAMYKQSDKADLKGKQGDNNWSDLMENFEKDYAFDLKLKKNAFVFGTNYQNKQTSASTYTKSVGSNYIDHGTLWNIQFINNYLQYKKHLNKKLSLSSVLYNRNATVLDNSVLYIVDTAQIGYYRPNNLTGIENILNYQPNEFFSVTSGLSFNYELLSDGFSITYSDSTEEKPPTPLKPEMEKNYLASIFVEPCLTLFQNLYLTGGLRFDQSSVYDQVFTPIAGIIYSYKNQLVRFSYAEAFRAPKPWDYNDGLGNSGLLPEKMKSMELAFSLSFLKNYKLDIVGYSNKLDNALTKDVLTEGYRWVNEGYIMTNGLESYLRYKSKKAKIDLNYTYTDSYNEKDIFIPEISKHSSNASLTYQFMPKLNLNLRMNYIGKRENIKMITSTNSKFIDPALLFHSTVSLINYHDFNLRFTVKNILNTEYYHTSNLEPERYRQPQRTFLFSVGYSISKPE